MSSHNMSLESLLAGDIHESRSEESSILDVADSFNEVVCAAEALIFCVDSNAFKREVFSSESGVANFISAIGKFLIQLISAISQFLRNLGNYIRGRGWNNPGSLKTLQDNILKGTLNFKKLNSADQLKILNAMSGMKLVFINPNEFNVARGMATEANNLGENLHVKIMAILEDAIKNEETQMATVLELNTQVKNKATVAVEEIKKVSTHTLNENDLNGMIGFLEKTNVLNDYPKEIERIKKELSVNQSRLGVLQRQSNSFGQKFSESKDDIAVALQKSCAAVAEVVHVNMMLMKILADTMNSVEKLANVMLTIQ